MSSSLCLIISMNAPDPATLWYSTRLDVFLNDWFPQYEKAHEFHMTHGGYLLPYKHHFYVVEPGVIRVLGLDPRDPDWEKIGFDCARPKDAEAYERLRAKRERVASKA